MKIIVCVLLALSIGAALWGCSNTSGHVEATSVEATSVAAPQSMAESQSPTCLTELAVDYSKSTEKIRTQLMSTTFDVGTNFVFPRDDFRLYRFGHTVEEVYSQLPEDDDAFALLLLQNVKQSDPVPGTNYPEVAETLAEAAEDAREPQIRIIIVGDGQNDYTNDTSFAKRYRNAARRLALNHRIKYVRFWGVSVGTREEIRAVFKPLGSRLQIQSLDQNPLAP